MNAAGPAIRAVFTALSQAIGEGELRQVFGQLGEGYESLAGMPTGAHATSGS